MTTGGSDAGVPDLVLVKVDGERCQGHNRCVATCPEVFEADEYGYSVVKLPRVGPELEEKVRLAEANCPENAISVERASTAGSQGCGAVRSRSDHPQER